MRAWVAAIVIGVVACVPREDGPSAKSKPCPTPAEPSRQATVIGTIGALHLAESQYPLTRIGDVIVAHKPDLVLLGVGVDAYRDDRLEDASFEMTYARFVAKQHGADVEAVDWLPGEPPRLEPVEPWDAESIARREEEILRAPTLFTFEQANGSALAQKLLLAQASESRYHAGSAASARRRGWITSLVESAVSRHEHPRRVLAVVDVKDRPLVDAVLYELGYATRTPVEVLGAANEVMAGDLPPEVLAEWKRERLRSEGAQARVLDVAIEKRGGCCVSPASLR